MLDFYEHRHEQSVFSLLIKNINWLLIFLKKINVLNILEIIQVNQVLMVLLLIIIILEIMILLINILINNIYTNKSAICIKIK